MGLGGTSPEATPSKPSTLASCAGGRDRYAHLARQDHGRFHRALVLKHMVREGPLRTGARRPLAYVGLDTPQREMHLHDPALPLLVLLRSASRAHIPSDRVQ